MESNIIIDETKDSFYKNIDKETVISILAEFYNSEVYLNSNDRNYINFIATPSKVINNVIILKNNFNPKNLKCYLTFDIERAIKEKSRASIFFIYNDKEYEYKGENTLLGNTNHIIKHFNKLPIYLGKNFNVDEIIEKIKKSKNFWDNSSIKREN